MPQLTYPNGRPITGADVTRARVSANSGRESGSGFGQVYEGASQHGQWFGRWPAHLQSADRDWIPARNNVTARSRDLFRNDPLASAAVNRKRNSAVGRGWRFSSKPAYRQLGISREAARELGQQIEAELKPYLYGYNFMSDAERRMSFGQQLRVMAAHLALENEFVCLVEYAHDEPTRYRTRLRVVDPDRLSNPAGQMNSDFLRAGVIKNTSSVPVAYWLRERHPMDLGVSSRSMEWTRWERYSTPLGRPQVLHGFDADRAEQTRGVSRFAAALKSFRSLARFSDATLQSATINALMLGYIQSSAGPEAVGESFSAEDLTKHEGDREAWYGKNPIHLGDATLPVLPLGDELKMATASKDVTAFPGFTTAMIRLIAASLGVTHEELSMDYSQTNYSSARAAMIPAWAETVAFMGVLEDQGVRPFFVAWLEEAFDSGYIEIPPGAPDFYDAIDAYAAGRWLGPGRGYIDPTKEILAAAARIEAGISTLEDECADQGKDYMDVMEQRAFEEQTQVDLGIPSERAILVATAAGQNAGSGQSGQPAPEDVRPADTNRKASALHRIAAFADTADHAASLDARPVQPA
jgi:lambda family phage portal protein